MTSFARLSIALIRFYQRTISLDTGILGEVFPQRIPVCGFYPTCSEYAIIAIQKYGALSGWARAIRRIFRCHPWQKPTIDEP